MCIRDRGYAVEAGDDVSHQRRQRVGDQCDLCGEDREPRERDEQPEERQAGDCIERAGEPPDRRGGPAETHGDQAQGERDHQPDAHGDGGELDVFEGADGDVCLLYTSDAADDLLCVDLGGRRIIQKKTLNT